MSQDLFAAFGDSESTNSTALSSQIPQLQTGSSSLVHISDQEQEADDDDFGDFEGAALEAPQTAATQAPSVSRVVGPPDQVKMAAMFRPKEKTRLPFSPKETTTKGQNSSVGRHPFVDHMDILFSADEDEYSAGQDEWNDLSNNPEAAMAYSKRVIQEQLDAEARARELTLTKAPDTNAFNAKQVPTKPRDPDVLFDAEDLSESETPGLDDEWGDFEDVGADAMTSSSQKPIDPASLATATLSMDLLSLDNPSPPPPPPPSNHAVKHPYKASQVRNPPTSLLPIKDDPWDDFEDVSHQSQLSGESDANGKKPEVGLTTEKALPMISPTNIPPPSVILSLLGAKLKTEATYSVVPELISTSWVLAHALAGRKLRWKRSPTLAASMRIGPAAAGGKSGMKLAGVDRAEMIKEEREVVEALNIWHARVGKLRTAVAAHNTSLIAHRLPMKRLPELAATMPIKALKPSEGAFSAPHECALCGLKRDERVLKVDENIEDSFGEWWIENASMHTICAEWWVDNEPVLRSK